MAHLAINGGAKAFTATLPSWPIFDEREEQALLAVLRSGRWGGYPEPGPNAAAFADAFARFQGFDHGICCVNGTVTLSVALRAAGVGLGDEVIIPAYTFAATGYAPVEVGAIPVMVDIDPASYCIDPAAVEAAITPRTRAIIPVHIASLMADMDAIMDIAQRHNLAVIEDCAHAHGAQWNGRGAGGIGHYGSFSFQSSKILTSGEGGLISTSDDTRAATCHALVDCGRSKEDLFPDAHLPELLGANLRLSELQAALLGAQLTRLDEQTEHRAANAAYMDEALSEIPGVRALRPDPRLTRRAVYQYVFALEPEGFAGRGKADVLRALRAEGLYAGWGWPPMNRYELFRPTPRTSAAARLQPERFDFDSLRFPTTERASAQESIWLDHSLFLGERAGIDQAVETIRKVQRHADEIGA
ncbi:MAG: DegT/DnrJ/EryC1/StrS family aminotransferase [Chloroflexales bacterium]|nr:DegT/DnrJ/EryC1/StrS family aminotransferase [Chloroflexales bacterium]